MIVGEIEENEEHSEASFLHYLTTVDKTITVSPNKNIYFKLL